MVKSLDDLPQNVIQEILVRLPLKTLFASRCVCRNFFDLTSLNAHFIELHSSNALQSLALQFVDLFGPSQCIKMFEPDIEKSEFRPIFEVPCETECCDGCRSVNRYVLVNSCNGLLFFCVRHTAVAPSLICNPVTNEIVKVGFGDSSYSVPTSEWLGFDSSTNQYKILRIFSDESIGRKSYVVDLLSHSVRDVEYTPLGSDHSWDASYTFVNGVIHWFDSSQENIVLFDFEKEMFGEVALPLEVQLGNKDYMSIGVLEGCLALSYNDFSKHHVNIWVMETRKNRQCWRKKLAVDTTTLKRCKIFEQFKPLQILRNGELLMLLSNNDLVYYDPKNTRFRLVGLSQGVYREVVVFTPSFISLKNTLTIDNGMVQNVRPRTVMMFLMSAEEWALAKSKEL